jgi:hypothetical protein
MRKIFKQFLLPFIYGTLAAALLLLPMQLATPANAEEAESECWAVIVGVSDYQNLPDLTYADDDAQDLANQLGPIWGNDHIKLLTNSMATKQGIENAMTDWLASREGANDVVLFFWSGLKTFTEGYLFPYDSLLSSYTNDISDSELNDWLSHLDSQKIVIMNIGADFLSVLSGTGRVILTSSTASEGDWYVGDLGHSVFTYYILEALDNFVAANSNTNPELSVEEIFDYAETKTTEYTASHSGITTQHPQISDRYEGDLSLLIKVTADVDIDLAMATGILSIDGQAYSSTSLPITFIWAPGSLHNFEAVSTMSGESGERFIFNAWNDANSSSSRTISRGGIYTANYKKQKYLTIASAFGNPQGEGWYDFGVTATISVTTPLEQSGTKHTFTGWSGDFTGATSSASVVMNEPKTVTANWRNEYLLTVESDIGEPQGEGWYNSGSTATISVTSPIGIIIRQVFTGWSGDFTGDTASASVVMNEPKTVTANWTTDYMQLYIIIIVIIIVLAGVGVWFIRIRRRKAPVLSSETTQPPPAPTRCPNCGAKIQPEDVFCITCGKPIKGKKTK